MWSPPPCEGNSWRPSSGGGGAPRGAGPPQPRLPVRGAERSGRPTPAAGPAPRPAPQRAGGNLRLRLQFSSYGACPCQGKCLDAQSSPPPPSAPFPALRGCLKHFPHFFLASKRGCCSPGGAATLNVVRPSVPPPLRPGDPGRAAWEGGRAWKQRESVREQAGDGG